MPIYEYECGRCRNRFELRRGFNDDSIAACPKCASEAQRLFTPVPIIFKGSGFYTTDHRGPAPAENEGNGNGSKGDSIAKNESTESSTTAS